MWETFDWKGKEVGATAGGERQKGNSSSIPLQARRQPLSLGRVAGAYTRAPGPALFRADPKKGKRIPKLQSHMGLEVLGVGLWLSWKHRSPPFGDLSYLSVFFLLPTFLIKTDQCPPVLFPYQNEQKTMTYFYIWALYALNCMYLLLLGF